MNNYNINTVIMSGGCGSRLWPLSRASYPKQFLPMCDNNSLIQQTILRLDQLKNPGSITIVSNEKHRFMVAEQLRQINIQGSKIILEPCMRNTAPAVALAALQLEKQQASSLMLVLASDHAIKDEDAFCTAVEQASAEALKGNILTFGIVPDRPATGYGYIKTAISQSELIMKVEQFVEKPDLKKAQSYIQESNYFWNSGMFLVRSDIYLEELKKYRPDIYEACCRSWDEMSSDADFIRPEKNSFEACPKESIDYAIMEKSSKVKMIPLSAGWSDVGTWDELSKTSEADEEGNVCLGDIITHNSKNNYFRSSKKLMATVGVEDLIVVDTDDALLVAHKNCSEDVKKIVNKLELENRPEAKVNQTVFRPWGSYSNIDAGASFKVKHITVQPGAKLSLQKHFHRAEHWVIVKGTALVTNGDNKLLLSENQSTYIPIGTLHRLENPGKIALELIEVQSGNYLEEDDIVRYEDDYGREQKSLPQEQNDELELQEASNG